MGVCWCCRAAGCVVSKRPGGGSWRTCGWYSLRVRCGADWVPGWTCGKCSTGFADGIARAWIRCATPNGLSRTCRADANRKTLSSWVIRWVAVSLRTWPGSHPVASRTRHRGYPHRPQQVARSNSAGSATRPRCAVGGPRGSRSSYGAAMARMAPPHCGFRHRAAGALTKRLFYLADPTASLNEANPPSRRRVAIPS
jgi:hypothetical protein